MPTPQKKRASAKRKTQRPPNLTAETANVSRELKRAAKLAKAQAAERQEALRSRYQKLRNLLQQEIARLDELAKGAKIVPSGSAIRPEGTEFASKGLAFDAPAADFSPAKSPSTEIGPAFKEFLGQVGEAMIDAQQQLDNESRKYLTGTVPAAMPAMFRLPRLNAKVQFDFTESTTSGLNFVFYRTGGATREFRQHTLDFEIVAAPPPPGFNPSIPGWRLLTGNERATVLAALPNPGERPVLWELSGVAPALLLADAPPPAGGQLPHATLNFFAGGKTLLGTIPLRATSEPNAPVSQMVATLQSLAEKQAALGS